MVVIARTPLIQKKLLFT